MAHKVFRSFDSKTHLWPYIFGIRMSILKIFIHLSKKNQSFASNGLSKDPCQFFSPIKWRSGCAVENIQYPIGSRDKFPIPVSRISMISHCGESPQSSKTTVIDLRNVVNNERFVKNDDELTARRLSDKLHEEYAKLPDISLSTIKK